MADLLVGLAAGLVLMGSAWAWADLRRRQRAIDQQHATQAAALALQDALLVKLARQVGSHGEQLHAHDADIDQLSRRAGVERYVRGGGSR